MAGLTKTDLQKMIDDAVDAKVAARIAESRAASEEASTKAAEKGLLPKTPTNDSAAFVDAVAGRTVSAQLASGRGPAKVWSDQGELVDDIHPKVASRRVMRLLAACKAARSAGMLGSAGNEFAAKFAEDCADAWGEDTEKIARSLRNGARKALEAGTQSAGGIFVDDEMASDMISLLRPRIVVDSLGARELPLPDGALRIPKQTSGSSGGWLGESQAITITQPGFGELTMRAHKYASLVPITNDLIRSARRMDVNQFVMRDLQLDAGTRYDLAYLRGTGGDAQPVGLQTQGVSTATNGTTLDQIILDLVDPLQRMGEANLAMDRIGRALSWRMWKNLYTKRFANDSTFVFRDEMNTGNLLGAPFRVSTNIPTNLGGGAESLLFTFDLDEVVIGRGMGFQIDQSQEATYVQGSTVVSTFQNDQSLIRMISSTDILARRPQAVQVTTGVAW